MWKDLILLYQVSHRSLAENTGQYHSIVRASPEDRMVEQGMKDILYTKEGRTANMLTCSMLQHVFKAFYLNGFILFSAFLSGAKLKCYRKRPPPLYRDLLLFSTHFSSGVLYCLSYKNCFLLDVASTNSVKMA